MATLTKTVPDLFNQKFAISSWTITTADGTGDPEDRGQYSDRTVQVQGGTWGSATLLIEGSIDGVNWTVLTDPQGNAISKTSDFIEAISEGTPYIRPRLSVTGTAASIVVRMCGRLPI